PAHSPAEPLHRQRRDDRRRRHGAIDRRPPRRPLAQRGSGPGAGGVNYEAVLAGLPDAVIAVDAGLRVVFWNAAAEVLTARSSRRAQGRLVKEVFPPNTSLVSRLTETLATGEGRSEADGLLESTDGRAVPVSLLTAALHGRDGAVEG